MKDLDKGNDKSDTSSTYEEKKKPASPKNTVNQAQLEEQRLAAEREKQRIEEEQRQAKLRQEAEEKARIEAEKAKKLEERINKKTQAYLVQIPDFGGILKNQINSFDQ